MNNIFAKLLYEMEKQHDTVLVTIINDRGSAPRGAGSQMLVGEEGRILGTIGGGAVEKISEDMAKEVLKERKSRCHFFQLHSNAKEDIGMVCGGDVTVLFQYIPADSEAWKTLAGTVLDRIAGKEPGWVALKTDGSEPSLVDNDGTVILGSAVEGNVIHKGWVPAMSKEVFCMPLPIGERAIIFGGGHCAAALAPLLTTVGFRVTVFDEREEYANRDRFPNIEHVMVGDYTKLSDYFDFTPDDYVVVMTNGHKFDMEVEAQVLRTPMAYVGVIGSRKKIAGVKKQLLERGITEEAIDAVHAPIGTNIKAVTPEEIAVSITGEMIYERALRRENGQEVQHGCPMH